MSYRLPTIPDFKAQFVRDFPYAVPLSKSGVVGATGTASLFGDGVSSIAVVLAGSGYGTTPPPVVIYGGGGVGAEAAAVLIGGAVTSFSVTNPGFGYTSAPFVYVGSGGGDDTDQSRVTDRDIASAFIAAFAFNITQTIFSSQAAFIYAYNLLSAHYLCQSVIAGGSGLGGQAQWLTNSKMVGNVSEAYSIPERILRSPYLAKLSKTTYGAQFLELVSPQLVGNFQSFRGITQP